jgi:glycogen debranching enzyme
VACAPQAWAAGAVFLLLQACLGLRIRANESRVYLEYPLLPESLKEIRIHNLRIGSASVDLQLQYHHYDVGVNVLDRTGNVEVVAIK